MLNKATSPLLIVVPVPRLQNLGEEIHNAEVKMFVNGLSEVDVILSKVNVLMSEVNVKSDKSSNEDKLYFDLQYDQAEPSLTFYVQK